MNSQLKYIRHRDINGEKWAQCIENADNSRFYANVWHLDRAAVVWDALVWGDYAYVMPIPVRKKFGFVYVYQPLFCQQLGIFPQPPKKVAELFYQTLFEKFSYSDIHFNSGNPVIQINSELQFLPRNNYLLDLKYNYKSLARSYSTNTKPEIPQSGRSRLSR